LRRQNTQKISTHDYRVTGSRVKSSWFKQQVCQLPSDPGPCRSNKARYYYDTKTGQCRIFLYGGCLGNANRFVTRRECEIACAEFPSRVMMKSNVSSDGQGPETAVKIKEAESEPQPISVEVFDRMWRITQHHTDHFRKLHRSHSTHTIVSSDNLQYLAWDLCLESHSYGTCPVSNLHHMNAPGYPHAQLTRYFYDRRLGKCQPFTYTGCGARGNHFDTIDSCKIICEDRLRNPSEYVTKMLTLEVTNSRKFFLRECSPTLPFTVCYLSMRISPFNVIHLVCLKILEPLFLVFRDY
ncbi:unnamed protein product, partial [Echinostoma caproni]|uniref:BPTI/Kunitz inhibitor domain-containing protein n=1 Tax=Echinostoma caproni TaxID=27848 RepID=A0A183BCP4_9TREM